MVTRPRHVPFRNPDWAIPTLFLEALALENFSLAVITCQGHLRSSSQSTWFDRSRSFYARQHNYMQQRVYAIARPSVCLSVRWVDHRTRKLCYRKDDRAMRAI